MSTGRQRQIANPAVTQDPELAARAEAEFRKVSDMLLDRFADRDLNDGRFRQDRWPDDIEALTAASQVLRVLAKPVWSANDLDLFDCYFPAAVRSDVFGDEFEEARFRIRAHVDQARRQLGMTLAAAR